MTKEYKIKVSEGTDWFTVTSTTWQVQSISAGVPILNIVKIKQLKAEKKRFLILQWLSKWKTLQMDEISYCLYTFVERRTHEWTSAWLMEASEKDCNLKACINLASEFFNEITVHNQREHPQWEVVKASWLQSGTLLWKVDINTNRTHRLWKIFTVDVSQFELRWSVQRSLSLKKK